MIEDPRQSGRLRRFSRRRPCSERTEPREARARRSAGEPCSRRWDCSASGPSLSPGPGGAGGPGRQGHARDDPAGRMDRGAGADRQGAGEHGEGGPGEPSIVPGTPQGRGRSRRRPGPVVHPGAGAQTGGGREAQPGQDQCIVGLQPPRLRRGAGVPDGGRAVRLDSLPPGELHRADEALPRAAQAVRSSAEVRGHADRGPGAQAGRKGRRRDRRRARSAVRSTGFPGEPRT